ncbi:hypothetical protein DFH07DRAFT_970018 [Mycena maculata]|uniref:Ubiquitin-like protease family profile domain-containing protein n=1 Tax=Mycena maculata TaxID=230809 RepID=A0AAD7HTA1_9AGAR|nr:hypothetical protein DFH07DRAFT_970018 [Mycena maculata]
MPPEHFDLSADDPPFDPGIYIGQGKTFPKGEVHPEIHAALTNVLELPMAYASLIPGPNLPVTEFLKLMLPQKSSGLVFSKPEEWFSKDAPTVTLDSLLTRPIPSQEFLDILTKHAGQAWFDGRTSIRDPRHNDGSDRFPLWTLTLWKEYLHVGEDQRMWQRSRDWIQTELKKPHLDTVDEDALMAANSLLNTLGWDTKIHGSWTTFDLALVLSHAWLTDDHIDMMMADLSARLAADPELAAKVIIAPLAFSIAITNGAKNNTYHRKDSTLLARYEEHIKSTALKQLYFPLNIHANDWIAGLVDFEQGLIRTGDSRVGKSPPPRKFIKDLKRWLKKQFSKDFVYQGDSLEHGDQQDGSSCSIVTRNIIAANVFGEVLWDQKHAAGERATGFVHLVRSTAIRRMAPAIPKAQTEITAETPAEISITVAIGDHNFPDLAVFALGIPIHQSRPKLADLLNPAPGTSGVAEVSPESVIPDVSAAEVAAELPAYLGDHRDVESDGECPPDGDGMDVDPNPPQPTGIQRFFKLVSKGKSNLGPSTVGKQGGKRGRKAEDLDESADYDAIKPAKKLKKANGTGTSKSAMALQKNSRHATLRTTGKFPDPKVMFHLTDIKVAYHSLCGGRVTMGEVYEAGKWNFHHTNSCPVLHPEKRKRIGDGLGGTPTLKKLGFFTAGEPGAKKPRATIPCPGITASTCPRLPVYLIRTGAAGGGARSLPAIASQIFSKLFRNLNSKKKIVANTQCHERKWINDHTQQRVLSTRCKKTVVAVGVDDIHILPCSECSLILGNAQFKQAIRLRIPDDENYIYVNHQYRNQALGHIYARTIGLKEIIETSDAKNTPCIKFVQGTLQGKYNDFKVFGGLVEAMVQKADRLERGMGMQNFKYPPAWGEIAHIVNIHSPRAAKALREHLPIRGHRSFREKEARESRFPMELGERNFTLVQDYLASIKYDGPTGLSCDDTKLFPALRLYHDKTEKADFLVGAFGGPIR